LVINRKKCRGITRQAKTGCSANGRRRRRKWHFVEYQTDYPSCLKNAVNLLVAQIYNVNFQSCFLNDCSHMWMCAI
jgi:hypothetical protein